MVVAPHVLYNPTAKMKIVHEIKNRFEQRFGKPASYMARAPGRVNLLGEHVDYNDGFVLPAAIDRATYIAVSEADSDETTLLAADFHAEASFSPQTIPSKTKPDSTALPDWAHYPAGVMWALLEERLAVPAMQAVYASEVPRGSGLSSSASVEMAFMTAWQALAGWSLPPMRAALLAQKAENEYVGVNSGIMDQFASACGVKNKLLLLDCRTLEWQTIPLPAEVSIVIANTKVRRKLTSGEYNKRRLACEEAVRLLKEDLVHIKALRDVPVEAFNRLSYKLPQIVAQRARHVVEEIERTRQAPALLAAGEVESFGVLMNECHISLRDLYEVSCTELDVMVRLAQNIDGCYGARLTGAGFGGCTVNLVAREHVDAFAQRLATGYEAEMGYPPEIYISYPSEGAGLM
jgi:galactokinase